MKIFLFVGLGGAVGSLLRYLISFFSLRADLSGFPLGTLVVNLMGSFILGWLTNSSVRQKLPSHYFTAITTGVIGSFTTLSTFSVDVVVLLERGNIFFAVVYMLSSLFGGLYFAFIGLKLGKNRVKDVPL